MNNEKNALLGNHKALALLSIILTFGGVLVGYLGRHLNTGGFGLGTIVTFVSLLLSLMSVSDKDDNLVTGIAFFLSVAGMFAAVTITSLAA